jgi:ABC-2 type transport system permease protein
MLAKIAAFETRYHLRSPLFYVGCAIFFLLTFGSVVVDQIQIGARGNVNINSPFAILQTTIVMNIFGLFVLVAFVANAVIRDDETGFAPIIRATRMTKFQYLSGRFLGASLVALAVLATIPLAILVGSWMPWLDAEKIGPTVLGHYGYALFVYCMPTALTMGAAFFALATATRSMIWTYVGAVALLVLYIVSRALLNDPEHRTVSALADPFGIGAVSDATRYWTAADRNSRMPAIEGLLLYNRLIWLSMSVVMFALAYGLFRFDAKGSRAKPQNLAAEAPAPHVAPALVSTTHAERSACKQFAALLRFDLRFVFKSPAFFVLLAIGVLNSYGGMTSTVELRGTEYFPVTRTVVQALVGAFSLFPMIIAIFYGGELVWRDRDRRMHEIVDATAAPNWTFLVPKVVAITLILLACYGVAALTGAAFQLFHGYRNFEWTGYFLWFVLPGTITAAQLAALSVFAQALVPNKFFGWGVMLIYIVSNITLGTIGFEHDLYNFGSPSTVPLSDMNGMGRFWIANAWLQLYWSAFSLLLLTATQLLWRRGVDTNLVPRLRRAPALLSGGTRWVAVSAACVFLTAGGYIFYNTNVLNDYTPTPEREARTADYEKTLLAFEKQAQPRIVAVQLSVDIEPNSARATTTGRYTIENRTAQPLAEVHVRWVRPLKMQTLQVEGGREHKAFAEQDYRIYQFEKPMQPGEQRTIGFSTLLEQRGFPNSGALTSIVGNGTFLNNTDIAPLIGMDRNALLQDRSKRRKYGLPAELRPPKLEDQTANRVHYLRSDSDWVTAELTVTTDADQTPIAPGYTVSDTVRGNRRTLVTRTEAPIMHFFSIQSGRYAVEKDTWTNINGEPVELAVYYHPAHYRNVRRMLDVMKVSLQTFSQRFTPFQFKQVRVLEFPGYADFAQSFANTIPYSENIGFIQNFDEAKQDEQVDLVTFVTAHEIAHQWWAHQIIGANKQGMTLLSESFAEYSALLVMEKLYGKEQIRKFLKYELDAYLRSRGGEVLEELPLVRVENQDYIHYRKGSMVMYWLKETVGEDKVNRALRNLLSEFAFKPAPYPSSTDFMRLLRAEAGPEHEPLIVDLFEKITLYDMKASDAKASKLPDGRYQISFTAEGRKLYADGQGKETEAPLNEPFEIGVFTAEPGKKDYRRESVLLMERRPLKDGKQTIELVVASEPKFVGVDPYNKRIDRNSDDNLTRVTLAE